MKTNSLCNHLLISPNGSDFVFVHRVYINGVRQDHLFGGNVTGKQLKLISEALIVSHYSWLTAENSLFICMTS